jgi:hypothetical protein
LAGKITNCQIGVSLSIATSDEHVPIDFELYIPECGRRIQRGARGQTLLRLEPSRLRCSMLLRVRRCRTCVAFPPLATRTLANHTNIVAA